MRFIKLLFFVFFCGLLLACDPQSRGAFPSDEVKAVAQSDREPTQASPDASPVSAKCDGTIWSGTVGGKSLLWTGKDVFLMHRGRKQGLFRSSAVSMHRAGVDTTISNLKYIGGYRGVVEDPQVKSSVGIELVSVVDPIVTFQIEVLNVFEGDPGSVNTWWLTLDLSTAGKIEPFSPVDVQNFEVSGMADLRTIFTKDELYSALIANPDIRRSLESESGQGNIELLKNWMDRVINLGIWGEAIPIGTGGASLIEYSFQHFVFDRIEDNKVAVRLAIINLAAADHYPNEFVEILLPLDGPYGTRIYAASRGEGGFLQKDRESISKGCETSIDLSTPVVVKKKKRID